MLRGGVFEELTWDWCDKGWIYELPQTPDGQIQYGNIEGVTWLTPRRIVSVPDNRKDDQPESLPDNDLAIHIFGRCPSDVLAPIRPTPGPMYTIYG